MNLEILAGTSYDKFNTIVPANSEPITLDSPSCTSHIVVRLAPGVAANDPYFQDPERKGVKFSIQFTVDFKKDINGNDLVFGNDFDHPIRDLLPWGFSVAFNTFKRLVDPSVEGDVYADKPYLYGPALTSINYIGDGSTYPVKETLGQGRQKTFLDESKRKDFVFKKGSTWAFDFCTPYLDIEKLSIQLPGFTFNVGKYAGETSLRYVLKVGEELCFGLKFDVADKEAAKKASEEHDATESNESKEANDSKDEKPDSTKYNNDVD